MVRVREGVGKAEGEGETAEGRGTGIFVDDEESEEAPPGMEVYELSIRLRVLFNRFKALFGRYVSAIWDVSRRRELAFRYRHFCSIVVEPRWVCFLAGQASSPGSRPRWVCSLAGCAFLAG
jgi:hypothetical protein